MSYRNEFYSLKSLVIWEKFAMKKFSIVLLIVQKQKVLILKNHYTMQNFSMRSSHSQIGKKS